MSEDLKTDSVPDAPREVIEDQEEATSFSLPPESVANEEKSSNIPNENKSFLQPPQASTFTTKKKTSPKTAPKSPRNKIKKENKKAPEPTVIHQIHISNSNGIQIGPSFNINIDKSGSKSKPQTPPQETDTIRALRESKTPVNRDHIRAIQNHVADYWKEVGYKLNLDDGMINQFWIDHHVLGIKEVVYQMILKWTQIEGSAASVGKLTNALWNSSEYSAVKKLAEWTKSH